MNYSVQYSWGLIVASVAISMIAAYAAFSLADRMRSAASEQTRFGWLLGGASAMGLGIWSMHYLGMLAVKLPVDVRYSLPIVGLSLLLAILAAVVALVVVSSENMGWGRLVTGGVLMGAGIGGMHYVGMSAMRMQAMDHYTPWIVSLSIALAVGLSTLALWIAYAVRDRRASGFSARLMAGALMGVAIASMHYTAMAGVQYMPGSMPYGPEWTVQPTALGEGAIAAVTLLVLALALGSAAFNRRQFHELKVAQGDLLEMQAQLTQANSLLKELAIRDSLTGLHNRRHFDALLDVEWRRATRSGTPLALMMIDVDHFKALNDLEGHQAGDDCLRRVAEALEKHPRRPHDLLARYGGEEFVLLLPGAGPEAALRIAEEMRELVLAEAIEHGDSPTSRFVTVSIGVCSRVVNADTPADQILEAADAALYEAKDAGRNRVVMAKESVEARQARGAAELSAMLGEKKKN